MRWPAGTELYPRIGQWFDIKTWTNCRMGMMSWTFITICFAYKQAELYGTVSNGMLIAVILTGASCVSSCSKCYATYSITGSPDILQGRGIAGHP
jgi:Ergosterol biosynthesis ERG4/ERG24 family